MKTKQQPERQRTSRLGQRGMASIVITMVTMVVVSLIVLGFAALSRREQRQTLDQQLSTQAFYAAESGVEDARAVIRNAVANAQQVASKTSCTPTNSYPATGVIDADKQVSYTCLKVDPAPSSLLYNGVDSSSLVVPINTPQSITSLTVTWTPSTSPSGSPAVCPATTTNVFSPQTKWQCGYGVLRADVVPTGGTLNRAGLASSTLTGFFVPLRSNSSGQLAYSGNTAKANLLGASCSTGSYGNCTATFTNFTGQTSLSLRLSSLYRTSNLKIVAYHNGTPMAISGVQAVIDSTGKAVDVLRRIQVRLPVTNSGGTVPSYALQSNGAICKRFSTTGNYFNIPGDIADADTTNPMCVSKTDGTLTGGDPGNPGNPGNPGGGGPSCTLNNDIVFALDASWSMSYDWNGTTRIAKLKEVATDFAGNSGISVTGNRAALVRFGKTASTLTGLSTNTTNLKNYITGIALDAPNSGTNYLPALGQISGQFPTTGDRPKVLIFMSDGAPYDNTTQIRQQATSLKNSGIRIYTIGIGDHKEPYDQIDEQLLRDMAGNGGSYGDANQPAQLTAVLKQISDDLSCR